MKRGKSLCAAELISLEIESLAASTGQLAKRALVARPEPELIALPLARFRQGRQAAALAMADSL